MLLGIGALSAQNIDFAVETRIRLVNDNQLQVLVQVDNDSELPVTHLEGFLTGRDGKTKIVLEQRLVMLKSYEPHLVPGNSITRDVVFDNPREKSYSYHFHISKVQFLGDHRVYFYHPECGLTRID